MGAAALCFALWMAPRALDEPARFEFRDQESYCGRNVLHFRDIVLRAEPSVPLAADGELGSEHRYGVVLVGASRADALAVVWSPAASGPGRLWLDCDGDGRLASQECHVISGNRVEILVEIALPAESDQKGEARRVRRMLVFRLNDAGGLQYATRGCSTGRLSIGGAEHNALLTDANADGAYDEPGVDRIWIDLDDDRAFDPFCEQFLLGRPIAAAGETFLISSDAPGARVRVHQRSRDTGLVRVALAGRTPTENLKVSASLVSDFGELVYIDSLDQSIALPIGGYRVASLSLELPDAEGHVWSYFFSGGGACDTSVERERETRIVLLAGLSLDLNIERSGRSASGPLLTVCPEIMAAKELELIDCTVRRYKGGPDEPRFAEIKAVTLPGGKSWSARSGFA